MAHTSTEVCDIQWGCHGTAIDSRPRRFAIFYGAVMGLLWIHETVIGLPRDSHNFMELPLERHGFMAPPWARSGGRRIAMGCHGITMASWHSHGTVMTSWDCMRLPWATMGIPCDYHGFMALPRHHGTAMPL